MDFSKELELLKKLKEKFSRLPHNQMRLIIINDYIKLASFLIDMGELTEEDMKNQLKGDYQWFRDINSKGYNKYVNSYFDNIELIKDLALGVDEKFQSNPFVLYKEIEEKSLDFKLMLELIREFFLSFDDKIYNMYKKMLEDGRIHFKRDLECEGCSYNISFSDYPYVIINDKNNYGTFSTIAHELGHCYEHICNKTNKPLYDFDSLIEVPGIFFQKLFDIFMIENGVYLSDVYNERLLWKKMIYYMNLTNILSSRAFLEDKIIKLDASNNTLVIDKDFIDEQSNKKLTNALALYETNIDNFLYVLSDLVANYFIGIYLEDKKEGLLQINQFINEMYYTSLKDKLLKYAYSDAYSEIELHELNSYQKKFYHL